MIYAETVPILDIPEEDKLICTGNRKSARVEIRNRDTESSRHKIHVRIQVRTLTPLNLNEILFFKQV
jgi:hypothetical protein